MVITVLLTALSLSAGASHYRFDRVALVTSAERAALSRAGIYDTQRLLSHVATLPGRVWLARATGIALARLTALATQCDLLRIDSVGPSIVEVFQKSGVRDSRALANEVSAPLLERMRAATRGTAMRYRLPNESILDTWIAEAQRLRPVLDDIGDEDQTDE